MSSSLSKVCAPRLYAFSHALLRDSSISASSLTGLSCLIVSSIKSQTSCSTDLIVVSFYDFISTHDYFYEFFDFIKPCPYRSLQASQK